MLRLLHIGIVLIVITTSVLGVPLAVYADEYDEVTRQLEQTKKELENLQQANTTNKKTYDSLLTQMENIKAEVSALEDQIEKKELQVKQGERTLLKQKNLLDERIKSYYKNLDKNSSALIQLFAAEDLAGSLRSYIYQKAYLDEDKDSIVSTVSYISRIEQIKKELESEKTRLEPIKSELDTQSAFLATEINKADRYEGELASKIAELSAKQQSILSARSGGSITSVGGVPTVGDPAATIAFKSQAPANSFAAFSFGAYTHRNGMSQYGAKARAEAGQSYSDILKKYYPNGTLETRGDLPGDITVDGYGSMSFEDRYLMGIAEMPSNWHPEALKVQAVAARTYAFRRIQSSGSICTTEACQVYLPSKADNPPDAWRQAVQATRGQILTSGGQPISTQYASTSGGYLNTSGWDTTDNSNSGAWTSRAYESIAQSPWFYRAWYRQGYRDDANSCGRAHPWLSQEEMADIIHAWWLLKRESHGADTGRIIPVTINQCAVGGVSGSPYSMSELRDFAGKSGKAVTSISSVQVSNNGSGTTTNVRFETNVGSIDIPGSEFKEVFNIRAPGFISIPQFGFSFFNIEKS